MPSPVSQMGDRDTAFRAGIPHQHGAEGNSPEVVFRPPTWISVSQALERIRKVQNALPSHTRGGSRMRESRTYGSVRGALSNERPYRV